MKGKEYYNDIQKIFEDLPDNFNILEEQIDMEVQMEYFEFSKKIKEEKSDENFLECANELFLPETDLERKKQILIGLAGMDDVKAYRTLERFEEQADSDIRSWAVLALQENRMLLQTSLLDEQQFFISTGLGGKGKKLRYYVVFINRHGNEMLTKSQQKLLKDELIFGLKPEDGEFESIDFSDGFSTSLVLLPVTANIKQVFSSIIEECNQYGNFLEEDMIITNVKILSRNEILDIINKQDKSELRDGMEEE
ncbi:hypothetical protein SAMN05444274_101489 [Mariniphaga anaerophila]|uniref:Uncharacterized protein n=1 Tax=Mariniphaga anaerophila TaxID=1484053 RepID=A0A1M4TWA5_9BACT|nr:hypothetical protein [Mariniphaga anaerophila]SHE48634.1 hypothetical protein SAMN05444274_101489 [Mariniphaga anaerophila]